MSSALALAKKLGLARISKLDGSSSSCKTYDEDQKISYLFVIDFESTCWDNKGCHPLLVRVVYLYPPLNIIVGTLA